MASTTAEPTRQQDSTLDDLALSWDQVAAAPLDGGDLEVTCRTFGHPGLHGSSVGATGDRCLYLTVSPDGSVAERR